MLEISCKEKISVKMDSLTETEKKIAKYVLENYEDVLNSSITELSEHAKVSDASVVRFCRGLGYKGYQDFKIKAAMDILPKDKLFNPALGKDDNAETICKKVFNAEIYVLSSTLASMDMDIMEKSANMIHTSEKVVFFGSGGSLIVGKDALHKLIKIGIQAYVYEDQDLQLMASSLLSTKDLAIGISNSGSNYQVLKCLQNARINGAKTLSLVGQDSSPIAKIADVSISTTSEKTIFQSETASIRIAQLAILDSLTSIVAFKNYDASYNAIEKTRRATSEHKF